MNVEKTRQDFPVLGEKINNKPIIYFDNACMTLRPRQVIDAMNEYYEKFPACHGRSSHRMGTKVTERYEKARETMAKFIGARKPQEVVFTRNTTEGLNLLANSLKLERGDVVLTTDREHNSNLVPWQIQTKKRGIIHKIVRSNQDMTFSFDNFESVLNKKVKIVSFVHSSNLDGYTLPMDKIIKTAHDNGSLVIVDAAQSMPHKPLNVAKLDPDFLAFSGHKMLGPSGTGVLYGKYHLLEELDVFIAGGDTVEYTTYESHKLLKPPEKFEAGLQNVAGAYGLEAAAKYIDIIGKDKIERYEIELNKIITEGTKDINGLQLIGPKEAEKRGGIFSFNIKNINYHDIALMLDEMRNIMIRSGQHCVHSWFNDHEIKGSVRASLYLYNTKEEAKTFVEELHKIAKIR